MRSCGMDICERDVNKERHKQQGDSGAITRSWAIPTLPSPRYYCTDACEITPTAFSCVLIIKSVPLTLIIRSKARSPGCVGSGRIN